MAWVAGVSAPERTVAPDTFHKAATAALAAVAVEPTAHALDQMWRRRLDPDLVARVIERPAVAVTGTSVEGRERQQYRRLWADTPAGRVYVCTDSTGATLISAGWRV